MLVFDADEDAYDIVEDFGDVDSVSNRVARETTVGIDLSNRGSDLAKLVPVFPGYAWIRMTGSTMGEPYGDLVLELDPRTLETDLERTASCG